MEHSTANTLSRNYRKQTNTWRSMKSLQPPLVGVAIGTGTVFTSRMPGGVTSYLWWNNSRDIMDYIAGHYLVHVAFEWLICQSLCKSLSLWIMKHHTHLLSSSSSIILSIMSIIKSPVNHLYTTVYVSCNFVKCHWLPRQHKWSQVLTNVMATRTKDRWRSVNSCVADKNSLDTYISGTCKGRALDEPLDWKL